jgi:hypothetical protein
MRGRILLAIGSLAVSACTGPSTPSDAGAIDAPALDARLASCAADGDCDDGIFCNGAETCSSGRCVVRMVACDDDVACTLDVCNEALRSCVSRPPDADGDGYDDAHCFGSDGVPLGNDCDDHDPNAFPANTETCDAHDEDCDPSTVGGIDADGDGAVPDTCCNPLPDGSTNCGDDCDDTSPSLSRLATEICDLVDNDCDHAIDEHVQLQSWPDLDGDGFGDETATPDVVCLVPSSRANEGRDCDDTERRVHPFQTEECNAVDDDCDGHVDEATTAACNDPSTGTHGECIAGRCIVTSCDGNRYDCNGTDADGCEADVCSNASSCGGCGRTCGPFTVCGGGLCPGINDSLVMGGVLSDVTGAPVANATITSIGVCPAITATTAPDGTFELGPTPRPPSIVRIEAPGYPTHVQSIGMPLVTQALYDAWASDPDRAASPSDARAVLVIEYADTFTTVVNDGILGAGNGAIGGDLLPSGGPSERQVFFDVVPGRTNVGGSTTDGAGCYTNCGAEQHLYLEAGAVTYVGPVSCSGVCI